MTSIIFVIIGLSLLILVHEWGHFLAARFFNLLVEEFGIGFPPRLLKKKIGETVFTLNAIPLGGFVKIYGENADMGEEVRYPQRSFVHQDAWKRATIIVAGVLMNFIFGWLVISAIFFVGSPSIILIETVTEDSPAYAAGIQSGDRVLNHDTIDSLIGFIDSNKGSLITLDIKRGSEELQISAVPRINSPVGEGSLGIAIREGGVPKHGLFTSIGKGFITSVTLVGAIFVGFYQVIFMPEYILGPVGIFDMAVNTGQLGLIYLFKFIALISLNLVVLNILPIPALDGGRLLFIIVEKIRGKRFKHSTELRANAIGFAFLIALVFLITIKDVVGLF
ncbi:MAG: site-2 protease family protein [Patescibacteria group bacterium]